MKLSRPYGTLVGLAFLAACGPAEPAPLTDLQRVTAEELGGGAADRLAGTLVGQLTTAIQEGGPADAIDFCAIRAMPLTEEVNAALDGLRVERTTRRLRNPANVPDSLEEAALAWFEAERARGGVLPSSWIQDAGDEVRYYRPLVANGLCVQCHGPAESLADDVRAALAERYPDDAATGYVAGDLRGLIRVSIPRSRLQP